MTDDGLFVPWLAAAGPLAYTPECPPPSDYYFQYSWIVPAIFADGVDTRRHFHFGESARSRAERVFSFWAAARETAVARVALHFGLACEDSVRAPTAVYACDFDREPTYVLMQHGSYQLLATDRQPRMGSGEIVLYRGIGQAERFHFLRVGSRAASTSRGQVLRAYVRTQARVLSDSVVSFNSIHDRARRSETAHIRDETWLTDDIAEDCGLDLAVGGLAKELWTATHQSFTLDENIAKWKFGPHYVKCVTPLDNIRLTTFFAAEHEVRILDPDRVEFLECVGCTLVETSVSG